MSILIKGGRIITSADDYVGDIFIEGEKIVTIGKSLDIKADQIIDAKNNVLGNKETVNFGDTSLTYSFITTVQYENKTVDVREQLKGKDFAKGTSTLQRRSAYWLSRLLIL